jgi:phosphoribosylamine-glycine ligase
VIAATATGATMEQALKRSYDLVENGFSYNGKVFRSDIGDDLIKYIL